MRFTIGKIAEILDGEVVGDPNIEIHQISALDTATSQSVSFLSNQKYEKQLYKTNAAAVIVSDQFEPKNPVKTHLIKVSDPYSGFTALLETFQKLHAIEKQGKEEPHFIGKNSSIGKHGYLGAFSYVGKNVTIGDHVKIYPQVHVGDHCVIGDHTVLYPGVKLYDRTILGKYCTVQAGAVLGSHGFGFAPQSDGSYKKIPQLGNVILGDHVDIGANTTIDCATFDATRIGDGVKIDNLVQVAHNVTIDKGTVIAAQTGISGSTKVGKNVQIGGQVGTVGHIHIADQTIVGARSGVTKDTRSGQVLFGVPAMDQRGYLKSYAVYKKLPQVMEKVEELEQKILNLTFTEDHS